MVRKVRRAPRRPRIPGSEAADPDSLGAWMLRFLENLRVRNYAESTIYSRDGYLNVFLTWCKERGLTRPAEVTRFTLQRFQRHLFHHRKVDGEPLAFRSQRNGMLPLLAFFKWLTRQNVILYNPANELELPRVEKRLPRDLLTAEEAERVLAQPDIEDPLGVRDRAILETLYSTGIRRMELARLTVYDLDRGRGTLMVRQGKGRKDRLIPIGERALAWVEKYLWDVRPDLAPEPDPGTLFLTAHREGYSLDGLTRLVRKYVERAEVGKQGACHMFRHSMATVMLENGADIRFVQEMLGHAQLSTTQIYTQVAIHKLKEVHAATHPSGRLASAWRPPDPDREDQEARGPEENRRK